ncbi:universal stress protein [Roseicyclus sp.]|uniref:universal stress protein n=1 Tax=Roseicyclus sp. TaxID=1914329 RepID=UPI003FA0D636
MERFRSILAVLSEESLHAVAFARAVELARANGAALTLVDVIDSAPGELGRLLSVVPGARGGEIEEDILAYHRDRLAGYAAQARASGIEVSEAVLRGVPFVEVVRMVLREGHDIVVKGATEGGRGGGVLKGFDMHLLRKCPCPVWMLTGEGHGRFGRILATVDPTDPEDAARAGLDRLVLDLATGIGARDGAEVHVAHAWRLREERALRRGRHAATRPEAVDRLVEREESLAEARLSTLMEAYPQVPPTHRHLLKGSPGDVIARFAEAEGMDLIVMGTVGRTGLSGFVMGNTAETILKAVRASVLAVKPDGFVTPVTLEAEG